MRPSLLSPLGTLATAHAEVDHLSLAGPDQTPALRFALVQLAEARAAVPRQELGRVRHRLMMRVSRLSRSGLRMPRVAQDPEVTQLDARAREIEAEITHTLVAGQSAHRADPVELTRRLRAPLGIALSKLN